MTTTKNTTKKRPWHLQPGDVVVSHYEQYAMDMTTMTMTKAEPGTDYLVVQSKKQDDKYVAVTCKKRRANGTLTASRTHYWTPDTELEVEA